MTTSSQPSKNTPSSGAAKKTIASNGPTMSPAASKPGPAAPEFSSLLLSDAHISDTSNYDNNNGGGWSDDDGTMASPVKGAGGDGWDDDDFGMSPSNAKINDDDSDFFASFESKKAGDGKGNKQVICT